MFVLFLCYATAAVLHALGLLVAHALYKMRMAAAHRVTRVGPDAKARGRSLAATRKSAVTPCVPSYACCCHTERCSDADSTRTQSTLFPCSALCRHQVAVTCFRSRSGPTRCVSLQATVSWLNKSVASVPDYHTGVSPSVIHPGWPLPPMRRRHCGMTVPLPTLG